MGKPIITIFELLDNFFGSENYPTTKPLNNRQIRDLRDHVLDFYHSFAPVPEGKFENRLFLGGFLSSPPFTIESSPYLSSALLYSDSIILFDPLHYWFSEEQYQRDRLLSASTGWLNLDKNSRDYRRPDYKKTKNYLAYTFPWLYSLRPLVETGKIILIPADLLVHLGLKELKRTVKEMQNLIRPVEKLAEIFPPQDITVDDNRKGYFAFAGGNKTKQIQDAMLRGFEQFAKDLIIVNSTNSLYTAPFRWEQHLGEATLNEYAMTKCHTNVVEGIRNLRLPILSGLSPDVLNKIHQDSGFDKFRKGLQEALYQIDVEIGSEEFVVRTREIEQDILIPKVNALHDELNSSKFVKLKNVIQEGFVTFSQTLVGNWAGGVDIESNLQASAITGGISVLLEFINQRKAAPDKRIWTKLLPENPSLPLYGSSLTLKEIPGSINGWNIPPTPSMSISIAPGLFKFPWEAQP